MTDYDLKRLLCITETIQRSIDASEGISQDKNVDPVVRSHERIVAYNLVSLRDYVYRTFPESVPRNYSNLY